MIIDDKFPQVNKVKIITLGGEVIPRVKWYNTETKEAEIYREDGTTFISILEKTKAIIDNNFEIR
jgi:hypothetical protein